MTHALLRRTPDLTADPYDIEIGGLVIFHRAGLLPHDHPARTALVEASNDYFWYAHLLEKLNDKKPPWDRGSKNEATPPEVFYETAVDRPHPIRSEPFHWIGAATLPLDAPSRRRELSAPPGSRWGEAQANAMGSMEQANNCAHRRDQSCSI